MKTTAAVKKTNTTQQPARRAPAAPPPTAAKPAEVLPAAAEWVKPSTLKPWARNPRKNDGEPVAKVAESIRRFGFAAPIVARRATREIIAGHTRWKAAQQLLLEQVPVRFVDISESEAHLLALADNRLGELAEWDVPGLHALLADYALPDVSLAGWSEEDLAQLAAALGDGTPAAEGGAEVGAETEPASFGLYPAATIGEALVEVLWGKAQGDFAPALPDVMVALNRCAAGKGAALSRCTDRWFPHRYDVIAGKVRQTPNQQLQSKEMILAAAKMTTGVMKQWGSVRELVNNILLCQGQCARQFPIDRARDIYREFCKPGAAVLDPCAGWGGRLLGWHCTKHGGRYEGYDAGAATAAGFAKMIAELGIENATVRHAAFEDVTLAPESFDFAFTSPPYFTLERYGTDAEQAEVRYPTYPAWRAGFLAPLIANTLAALRPGGAFVMNVSGVAGNDLPKHAAELARQHGVTVEGRTIDIGGTYKLGATRAESELEDLLILRKAGRMPRTKPAVSGGVK